MKTHVDYVTDNDLTQSVSELLNRIYNVLVNMHLKLYDLKTRYGRKIGSGPVFPVRFVTSFVASQPSLCVLDSDRAIVLSCPVVLGLSDRFLSYQLYYNNYMRIRDWSSLSKYNTLVPYGLLLSLQPEHAEVMDRLARDFTRIITQLVSRSRCVYRDVPTSGEDLAGIYISMTHRYTIPVTSELVSLLERLYKIVREAEQVQEQVLKNASLLDLVL